jgi:DNA-binding CsgD family transcriptional regulator
MKNETKSVDLPTYAVLVSPSGEILDVRSHHQTSNSVISKLKGRSYIDECALRFRSNIKSLLARERQLLSVVMPPPTLGIDAWFAVVGVPLGTSKDGGVLLVHMDISSWVAKHGTQTDHPKKISMNLVQEAMAATFVGEEQELPSVRKAKSHYDGVEGLTTRQREVLKLIGMGKSNSEIAEDLSCSLNTVKRHVTAVLQKLKLPNRTRAAMLANKMDDAF